MLFRRPVHEIAAWPEWELELLDRYLGKRPDTSERIELMLAELCAMFANVHRDKAAKALSPQDFLVAAQPWKESEQAGRYNEVDRQVLSELL